MTTASISSPTCSLVLYKVTISAPAFGATEQNNVQVDGNSVRRVDGSAKLVQVNQNVTVDASSVTLQTDRADASSQIQSSQVENLPLGANRNFRTLYKLIPGSSPPIAAHSSAGNPTGALATDVNGGALPIRLASTAAASSISGKATSSLCRRQNPSNRSTS